ncbi:MAG TPA: outer membrane beta-barrel protein [Capsulimonadaceae bacterium]|jgi:hypothetical protein
MKKLLIPVVLGVLALGTIGSVNAAPIAAADKSVEKPFSVKVGAHWSNKGQANDDQGVTALSAGVDYAFAKSSAEAPYLPSVYADYAGGSHKGGHLNTYGAGVAAKIYAQTPSGATASGASLYYGAGVGVYRLEDKNTYGGVITSKTSTSVGGKVLVGAEISGNYFVEGNYTLLPKVNGANPSGFGLQVGIRF